MNILIIILRKYYYRFLIIIGNIDYYKNLITDNITHGNLQEYYFHKIARRIEFHKFIFRYKFVMLTDKFGTSSIVVYIQSLIFIYELHHLVIGL